MDILKNIMIPLENKIGGKGVLDLFYSDGKRFTGKYNIEDRPIYRPLQYALRDSIQVWWEPRSRSSVEMSCAHIEQVLKKIFGKQIKGAEKKPMGTIISAIEKKELLNSDLIQYLWKINTLYRMAKHDFDYKWNSEEPESTMGSQTFNNYEALAMYFICRKIGVQILPPN